MRGPKWDGSSRGGTESLLVVYSNKRGQVDGGFPDDGSLAVGPDEGRLEVVFFCLQTGPRRPESARPSRSVHRALHVLVCGVSPSRCLMRNRCWLGRHGLLTPGNGNNAVGALRRARVRLGAHLAHRTAEIEGVYIHHHNRMFFPYG